jgi:surface polysaccharide O-acyltransferase-like enzyme
MTVLVIGNHATSYQYFVDLSAVFDYIRALAVPVFLILSAYFAPGVIDPLSSKYGVASRVMRLYTPAVIWGLVYFALYYTTSRFGNVSGSAGSSQHYDVSFANIVYQIVFGHVVNPALYYLIDLVWLTLLFYLVFVVFFEKRYQTALLILAALAGLTFQYSGLNWLLFSNWDYRTKFTAGRFCEFLPFFSIGFLLRKYGHLLRRSRWIVMTVVTGGSFGLGYETWNWHQPTGFGYQGLGILMGAMSVFCLFSALDFRETTVAAKIVRYLSGVTLGVYCMHNLLIPTCGLVFRHYGLTSRACAPFLFMTIVALSFLASLILKVVLRQRSKSVVA